MNNKDKKLTVPEIQHRLNKNEVQILKYIYDHRCLTFQQIKDLMLENNQEKNVASKKEKEIKRKIKKLIKYDTIEKEDHFVGEIYFLTTIGVNILRNAFDLPTNVFDRKNRVIRRGYYRAGELRIRDRYVNHQHSLNDFIIGFKNLNHDIYWKYYDEKHISAFKGIRPDGLLNVLDIDFFIEIDMNTESSNQLYEKWENYRRFLSSKEYTFNERKIIVLFVIENTKNPNIRIELVKHTIGERIMDKIDNNFEIYVDTKENLLELVDEKIRVSKGIMKDNTDEIFKSFAMHGFSVAYGELLSNYTGGTIFDLYARKIDENNNVIIEDGKVQEYVVDDYINKPFSVMKKIAFLSRVNTYFYSNFNRELSYIVVVESEEEIFRDLQLLDLIGIQNVYFTTINRLQMKTHFKNALFEVDGFGNVYTFKDNALDFRQFEKELNIID